MILLALKCTIEPVLTSWLPLPYVGTIGMYSRVPKGFSKDLAL